MLSERMIYMLSIYPAIFFEEAEGGYSVIFPDLGGAVTQGDDLNEAMSMAVDCLADYLYTLKLEGIDAPAASPVNAIDAEAIAAEFDYVEYKSALVNMVSVDVEMYAQLHFNKSLRNNLKQYCDHILEGVHQLEAGCTHQLADTELEDMLNE